VNLKNIDWEKVRDGLQTFLVYADRALQKGDIYVSDEAVDRCNAMWNWRKYKSMRKLAALTYD
jgi:hypothetical protein